MSATNSATASANRVLTQNLLKRRAGTTVEDFRTHYIERHGKLTIPWFLANGVTCYAQTHRPLRWASAEARQKYGSKIQLEDWDAIGEVTLAPGYGSFSVGPQYYQEVILTDERRFLLDEAFKHMQAVVEYEEWRKVWEEYERR